MILFFPRAEAVTVSKLLLLPFPEDLARDKYKLNLGENLITSYYFSL